MPGNDIIVVGASAGGVETLCQLVDGIMGMRAIKATGGYAIVAQVEGNRSPEYLAQVIPLSEITSTLINLTKSVE
jgi:hypothetical protein